MRAFNGPVTRAILPQLGARGTFRQRRGLEFQRQPERQYSGPFDRWIRLRHRARAVRRLRRGHDRRPVARRWPPCAFSSQSKPRPREPVSLKTVLAGIHYIWEHKVVLGSISLDLFAVLLGGAVALLPVYAREILKTGPWGLGLLRCSPAIGAGAMAILLAHRPLRGRCGVTMLWCVAGFGVFTILFGLSHSLISLDDRALVLVGATDMVSVMTRAILVQLATPDEMRGRVSAVDMIFIGASNELGQFESGRHRRLAWRRSGRGSGRNRHSGRHRSVGLGFPELRNATHPVVEIEAA